MKTLRQLLDRLAAAGLLASTEHFDKDVGIERLSNDSRSVGPNTVFVAIRGETADGRAFIDKAVENGAIAVVCEAMPGTVRERHPGVVFAQVADARSAWAELSAEYHDDPSRDLTVVGVTGTNGKSTTAYLLHHVLSYLGTRAGLVGTIAYRVGGRSVAASHTTPDAFRVNELLSEMRTAGCRACVMEVSSHALAQRRVQGVRFGVGVFTNLTQDHLDYHGSFDEYLTSKKRLFDSLPETSTAVYNADDPSACRMVEGTRARKLSYGQDKRAEVRFAVRESGLNGLSLDLDGNHRDFHLVGLFNGYNITAAYSAARALELQSGDILEALAAAPPVPGRFQQLRRRSGGLVIVDYAHTPDALENVLQAIHEIRPEESRVICVFGCGGDRDATKRPEMGSIAERLANLVVVTSDNPRSEDPLRIMDDIRGGFSEPSRARWIADRREAIREAARLAGPEDVVLIAGKGHETYQVVGSERIPFDDRLVAEEYLDVETG